MAKKKKQTDTAEPVSIAEALGDFVSGRVKKKLGTPGGNQVPAVLPFPLSFCWLSRVTGWPQGRITVLVGPSQSCKSALLEEFYRVTNMYGGRWEHFEVENKDTPIRRWSIFGGRDHEYGGPEIQVYPETMNDWMAGVKIAFETVTEFLKSQCGGIRTIPFTAGVDALTSALAEVTAEAMDKDKSPKKRYAVEASFLADFFRDAPSYMRGWPTNLVMCNHYKPKQDSRSGADIFNMPGGRGLFHAMSLCLEMKVIKHIQPKVSDAQYTEGKRVRMKAQKTSFGPGGRTLDVDLLWWYDQDPETGEMVQKTEWQWYAATVGLLLDLIKEGGVVAKKIQEVLDLSESSDANCFCPSLGFPKKTPFHEVGLAIESNLEVREALRKILMIYDATPLNPELDFRSHFQRYMDDDCLSGKSEAVAALDEADEIEDEDEELTGREYLDE